MFLLFQDTGWFEGWTWQGIAGAIFAGVLGLSALIGALNTIRTQGWQVFKEKWITPRKARRARQDALMEKVETVSGQVIEVLREVKPNGGTSLKDVVMSIDGKLDGVAARVDNQDETSAMPIFRLDETGKLTFANCAFRELVAAEESQLTYNDYLSRIEDEDRSRFIKVRNEAMQYNMPFDLAVHFKTEGPNFVHVRLVARPDVRHGGVLKGFFGTASECKAEQ